MKTCHGIAWGLECPKRQDCAHHQPEGQMLYWCNPSTLENFEPKNPFPTEAQLFRLERQTMPQTDTTMSLF